MLASSAETERDRDREPDRDPELDGAGDSYSRPLGGGRLHGYTMKRVRRMRRADTTSGSAGAMQLPQDSQRDIPALGGLAPKTRLAQLAEDGARAVREIESVLSGARRRARALAIGRAASLFGACAVVALLAGALFGSFAAAAVARTAALAIALAGAAGVALFCLRSPLQRAGGHDDRALARLLGGPSELLSSVELSREPPDPGSSLELLSLLHLRAASRVRTLDPRAALPLRALVAPLGAFFATLLLWLVVALLWPRPFALGLSRLRGGDAAAPAAELSPIVGDLSVTYLYPPYTGLPPRTEEGTAGDLRAPRGTELRLSARADRDLFEAYAIVNGAKVKLLAQGPGHRQIVGTLALFEPGRWSLRFQDAKGRTIAEGPPRPIEIVRDEPPQVSITEPAQRELEVDPNGKVALSYSATDDYGIAQVALVFQLAGGKEERVPLQAPSAPTKRLRGSYAWELSPLKLRAGDKVSYFVEAKDNDAVDGPQRGASPVQVLKVFSAAEHSRESLVRAQALWERLVALLADRIEEKPAPEEGAAGWYAQTSQKDKDALALSSEMESAGRALLKDRKGPRAIGRALRYAASGLGPAVQRTSIARAPLSRGRPNRDTARTGFQRALGQEIAEEEKDVLYLQDLLDKARFEAIEELGKELSASRRELSRLAEKLRRAPDEETKREILAEVSRLRERIQDLLSRMRDMAHGIRDEHLNQEAVESLQKQEDLLGQLSDIQRKLQSDQVASALKQLDKLGAELEELERRLSQKATSTQAGRYSEEARRLAAAARQLKEIEEREKALEKRTLDVRRGERAQAQKRFEEKGGKDLARRLREKVAQAKKSVRELREMDPKLAERLGLEDAIEEAQGRVFDLGRALEVGDFDEALDLAERTLRAADTARARLSVEEQLARRYPGFSRDPESVRKGLRSASSAVPPLQEIVSALSEALPREGQDRSAEALRDLKEQRDEQRRIGEDLQKARQELSEVGKRVPIFGPSHERLLQEAQEGMGQAEDRLGRGDPRGAQAGEEQALEGLRKFGEAMEEMAKNGGQGQGGMGMPIPWGEPGGEGDREGDSDSVDHERVEIPDAEASRAPAEFRKELLEAMKQAAPEKYRERVKQYYEELVK